MITGAQRNGAALVSGLFSDVFGISMPIYIPWGSKMDPEFGKYSDIEYLDVETDEDEVLSDFGTPVMAPVRFEGRKYNVYDMRTGKLTTGMFGSLTLPYTTIVQFSRPKNITKTSVLGGSGTVKEVFGLDDWKITLSGFCLPDKKLGISAQAVMDSIVSYSNIADSIEVTGSIFRRKNITNIVLETLDIRPTIGKWNVIPFQIEATSDEPIELTI